MTRAAVRLAACCLAFACAARADDGPHTPPDEAWPKPALILADADDGMLDASGKLWAWQLHAGPDETAASAWLEPSREGIEQACAAPGPRLVRGAELLLVDGPRSAWRVRGGQAVWLHDGKAWTERAAAKGEGALDGQAAVVAPGLLVFGLGTRLLAWRGGVWSVHALAEPSMLRVDETGPVRFVQDQAGAWYVYLEHMGSLWRIEATEDPANLLRVREIPVLDAPGLIGVGEVARHPDGSPEHPQLLAGGVLLERRALRPPEPASGEEIAALWKALASEKYEERERAAKVLREDGRDGAWRFGRALLDARTENADPEFRSQILKGILDRVARFEPGRAVAYARKLAEMGEVPATFQRPEPWNLDYKALWIALEEKGCWTRETRVGFERDRHESRLELRRLRERVHERHVMALPIGGEWNQQYACREFLESPGEIDWRQEYRQAWEDRPRNVLWMAMNAGGLWRVTARAGDACTIDPGGLRWSVKKVLGRDAQGRLLVCAAEIPDAKPGETAPAKRGIWALAEPPAPEK